MAAATMVLLLVSLWLIQNWVVVWASLGLGSLIPIVMALRTESNGPIGYCIIDSDDKNENQVPIFF